MNFETFSPDDLRLLALAVGRRNDESHSMRTRTHTYRNRVVVLVTLLVGVTIGAALVTLTHDDDSDETSSVPLATVQASCQDWMGSPGGVPSGDDWCASMFAYMEDQPGGSMMGSGSMMWQSPSGMTETCRDWVREIRSGSRSLQQCSDMVEWMDVHLSEGSRGWMMHDD